MRRAWKRISPRIEETEKRDHRKLGKEQDLFHFQEEAPGAVFWHPKGWTLFQTLHRVHASVPVTAAGWQEVSAPEVMDISLWECVGASRGRLGENMFFTQLPDERKFCSEADELCPGHGQIFYQGRKSYRDLPLRLCRIRQGATAMSRRALCAGSCGCARSPQDDGHSFCAPDQLFDHEADRHLTQLIPRGSTKISASKTCVSSSQRGRRSASVQMRFRTRPRPRSSRPFAIARSRIHAESGRGRVLRPEARISYCRDAIGRRLAMRHVAGRSQHAGASRRERMSPQDGRPKHTPLMLHQAIVRFARAFCRRS